VRERGESSEEAKFERSIEKEREREGVRGVY
jgi:hypothetical protein